MKIGKVTRQLLLHVLGASFGCDWSSSASPKAPLKEWALSSDALGLEGISLKGGDFHSVCQSLEEGEQGDVREASG